MSEIMRPIPFGVLVNWILDEYNECGRVFGLPGDKFYRNKSGRMMELFGEKLASPIGPAAGPQSQLTQNIVTAYLAGSRFVELKTCQIMDGEELRKCVARPCINAADECYNVEWSTELTVQEAFDEYVKAWFLLHVLAKEMDISTERDFAFNMSVGYNLDGIKSPKIDNYIEGLKNASETPIWKECYAFLEQNLSLFSKFTADDLKAVSPAVAPSIALSTLHGCPKEEIERIAVYLLTEKGIHTYIKCNPTLLGYKFAREKLDEMGFNYVAFDDHHFNNDLQYADAIAMFKRLMALAAEKNLQFGVKITNTFPVQIKRGELPGEEMYMSGRSLYPLTISLANKLTAEFGGKLPISYSGGADYFNIAGILEAGIQPVTVATTLLKPGGYARIKQLAEEAENAVVTGWNGIDVQKLDKLSKNINEHHKKDFRHGISKKTDIPLDYYSCFIAPCEESGCPINQQIPEYLKLVSEGRFEDAFKLIAIDNALPGITGTICDHKCQTRCNRIEYEESIAIRDMKKLAVERAADKVISGITPAELRTGKKVAVIGGGPAGTAAAEYLRRNGVPVTVFEKREKPLGIVSYVIPEFRIPAQMTCRDAEMAVKHGVEYRFGVNPDYDLTALKKEYDFVVLATGAWGRGSAGLKSGEDKLLDALEMLENSKATGCKLELGERVAVIGGGDVAMDCARAAKRNTGVKQVSVVYRRTQAFMPAEREEQQLALADGVEFVELLAPVSYDGKTLSCEVMRLSEPDASGRLSVVGTGETKDMRFDTVISAIGAKVQTGEFSKNGIELNAKGFPAVSGDNETNIANVYIAGDCKQGPSTVVKAMADAKKIAKGILTKLGLENDFADCELPLDADAKTEIYRRKGILEMRRSGAGGDEGGRCLECNKICELCCDVCPNRANVALSNGQILHIDVMCNECGNCGIFCPHNPGDPYKQKITLFWSLEDFNDSENSGFLPTGADTYKVRREDKSVVDYTVGGGNISEKLAEMIKLTPQRYLKGVSV